MTTGPDAPTEPAAASTGQQRRRAERRRPGGGLAAAAALGLLAAVVVIVAAFALLDQDSAGPETGVTIEDVADEPERYVGQTVTVSGEVDEVVAPNAFTIGDDDELLVVIPRLGPAANPAALEEDDAVVRITGQVASLELPTFEELADADLDDALFEGLEGEPVLIARSVEQLPNAQG
jgi:hypothetical protein